MDKQMDVIKEVSYSIFNGKLLMLGLYVFTAKSFEVWKSSQ